MGSILIVDDDAKTRWFIGEILKAEGFEVSDVENENKALSIIKNDDVELVYLDLMMPEEKDGFSALTKIKEARPHLPVVMLTAYNNVETAVKAIKLGAEDYLTKDSVKDRLVIVTKNILKANKLNNNIDNLTGYLNERFASDRIIFKSIEMFNTLELAKKAASTDITVLLTGESGTGKELVAKYIHSQSKRASQPLIAIDCAMLPENLIESELFGYEKGAFTGAANRKLGRIELADTGTLFLDEIGNLTSDVQKKLLRFLEEKTIERIGGKETTKVDAKLIAATNTDLKEAVKEKKFREDLLYRMNVFTINIPPLRERKGDVPLLASYFTDKFSKNQMKTVPKVNEDTLKLFELYPWPGNVREFRNVIERAVLLAKDKILPEHLPKGFEQQSVKEEFYEGLGLIEIGKRASAETEKNYILKVLKETNGNKSQAAKILKIDYKTLFNKIKEFGIIAVFFFFFMLGSLISSEDKAAFKLAEGFPVEVDSQMVFSSPVFSDINGNDDDAIIVASHSKLYALDKNGKNLPGWPVSFQGLCESTVAVGNLTDNSSNDTDIVVCAKTGPEIIGIFIYGKDAKLKYNTPWEVKGIMDMGVSPVLADILGNGSKEIIISASIIAANGPNAGIIYVFKKDGSFLKGWPQLVLPEGTFSQWLSTPVVTHLSDKKSVQILVSSVNGKIYAFNPDGYQVKGWPVKGNGEDIFYIKPTVCELDSDGTPDIIIGSCNNSQSGNLYAWKNTGELLKGYPVNLKSNIQSVAFCGDLKGDGKKEIVVGTNLGKKLWVFNQDGSIFPSWPVEAASWLCNNPIITDLTKTRKALIFIGGSSSVFKSDPQKNQSNTAYSTLFCFSLDGKPFSGFPFVMDNEAPTIGKTPGFTKDKNGNLYICYAADKKVFLWEGKVESGN